MDHGGDFGRKVTVPVEVIPGSGRVVFPKLVRFQGQDGESGLVPAPIDQLAFGEP